MQNWKPEIPRQFGGGNQLQDITIHKNIVIWIYKYLHLYNDIPSLWNVSKFKQSFNGLPITMILMETLDLFIFWISFKWSYCYYHKLVKLQWRRRVTMNTGPELFNVIAARLYYCEFLPPLKRINKLTKLD